NTTTTTGVATISTTPPAVSIINFVPTSSGGGGGSSGGGSSSGGGNGGGGGSGGGGSTNPPADTTPPTITVTRPSSVLSAGPSKATLSATTNEAATCVYSTSQTDAFSSATQFSTTGGTSHSSSLTGLQNATSYTYYIQCKDGAGNVGDASAAFSVAAAAPA